MRLKRRLIAFTILVGILCLLPFATTAQDAQPSITPIPDTVTVPILGEATEESTTNLEGAPVLESAPSPTPLPQEGADTASETTETTTTESTTTEVQPSGPVCPTLVQESFTATEIVCESVDRGEACVGNGSIESVFSASSTETSFASPGDTTLLTNIEELILRSTSAAGAVWSVVNSRIELTTSDGAVPVGAPMLVFGDVTIIDAGQTASGAARNASVIAGGGLNVRRTPGNDGVRIWQLGSGEQVLATGITADRQWIRIQIPNEFAGTGWVYAPYMDVEGGSDTLPYVTVNSPAPDLSPPEFGPMQAIELLTANTAPECNTIDSGVLLQSPSGIPDMVRIRINGVEVQLSGTAFIRAQADAALYVDLLEGNANIIAGGNLSAIVAGNRGSVTLDSNLNPGNSTGINPINLADYLSLPIRLLPRQVVLGAPADTTTTEATTSDTASTESDENAGFGTPEPTATPQSCTLTAPDEVRNVREGPGVDYPILRILPANGTTAAVGQTTDSLNYIWFATSDGGWLRYDTVEGGEACLSLPIVEPPPLPVEPTADPSLAGLSSSELGEVACPDGQVTASSTSNGSDFSIQLGGLWTAQAGTTVTFDTRGGQLRPEFGDFIQLVGDDGNFITGSGDTLSLSVTFDTARTFYARFSAGNGDTVVMSASCSV